MRRKTGTATNSRLWNWLAVPGLPHGKRRRPLLARFHIQGAHAPLADWVIGNLETFPKRDGLGPVQHRAQRSARRVSDYRMKKARADVSVGLHYGGDPGRVAAGSDVGSQAVVSPEVLHDAAQLLGRFQ